MTQEANLQDRPGGVIKRGGRGTGWGGRLGAHGDDGDEGDPFIGDFERLARMLDRIGTTLGNLINRDLEVLDPRLRAQFVANWPQAAYNLTQAILRLRAEAIHAQLPSGKSRILRRQLERAGLTGSMLRMKETSLNFYLDPIDRIVDQPLTSKESLGQRVVNKLLRWTKPGSR